MSLGIGLFVIVESSLLKRKYMIAAHDPGSSSGHNRQATTAVMNLTDIM